MPRWDEPTSPAKQIYEDLRDMIETERLRPGDGLPSNRKLQAQYGVASHTVQRAMQALKDERLIDSIPNKGMLVRERPTTVERSIVYTRAPQPGAKVPYGGKSEILELGETPAPNFVSTRMGLEPATPVFVRRRLLKREGAPVEIIASYYPVEIAVGTELAERKGLKGGSPGALERLGYVCTKSPEDVQARLPLRSEVELLQISPESPVFRLLRTVRSGERVVEVMDIVMEAAGKVLHYDL